MSLVALDVYAEDAPNGTLLGTLDETDLVSLRIDFQHRGLDWFEAAIRRDSAKASLVAADRYLKLRIPMVQATPLAGFWASELLYHLSSRRERGGELLKFGGPGALWILRLARLLHTWHAPGQTARGSANKAPNLWWWINEPYGAIALRAIQEGQYQLAAGSILAPLNGVTTDFTRTVDSAGVAWTNIAGEFETRVGTDVLALEAELQQAGNFYLEAEPNLLVHAWQTYPGRDLTASVHLQRAVNIASELARELKARHAFTHLVLEDAEGSYSTETLAGFTAGRSHVGYHHAPQTSDDPLLNRIGQDVLRASRSALSSIAVDVAPGAVLPGKGAGQVWPGDTVSLSSIAPGGVAGPQDYDAAPQLVTGIRLSLGPAVDDSSATTRARSLRAVFLFNQEHRLSGPSPAARGSGGPGGSHTHLDHLCPAFEPGDPDTGLYDLDWNTGDETVTPIYPSGSGTWPDNPDGAGWASFGLSGLHNEGPPLPATAGTTLRVSIDHRRSAGWGMAMYVQFIGAAGNIGSPQLITGADNYPSWTTAVTEHIVPTGADRVQFMGEGAGEYDNLVITRLGTAPRNPLNGTSILSQRCDSSEHEIAARDPVATDDVAAGYPRRTIWHNSATGHHFISTTDTAGAAVWSPVTAAATGVVVRRNSTGSDFERRRLNLIEGSGITIGIADDSANDEIDVTLSAVVSAAAVRDAGRWEPVIYDLGGGDGSVLMDGGSPPDALMDWRTT